LAVLGALLATLEIGAGALLLLLLLLLRVAPSLPLLSLFAAALLLLPATQVESAGLVATSARNTGCTAFSLLSQPL
jgi:hypothetical protein